MSRPTGCVTLLRRAARAVRDGRRQRGHLRPSLTLPQQRHGPGAQPVSRMPRVAIAGGSVGGLTAALVLRDAGCDVRVFERSSTALQARGAGIAALDTTLDYLLTRGGFDAAEVCSSTGWIRFLNRDGSVQHEQPHRYRFSSWNTIYRSLLSLLDADRYELGMEVTGFAERAGTVTVTLAGNSRPAAGPGPTCWCAPTASARPPGPGCCPRSARPMRVRGLARHRARAGPVPRDPRHPRRRAHLPGAAGQPHPRLPDPRPGRLAGRGGPTDQHRLVRQRRPRARRWTP